MTTWSKCTAEILYYDGTAADINVEGFIVRFIDDIIEVAYDDESGPVCYRGRNAGDGHYTLTAPERNGQASLHQMPNNRFLEGHWQEGKHQGMWRIQLKK